MKMWKKKSLTMVICFLVLFGASGPAAAAAKFPAKEITFIHWNDPGSSAEIYVRTLNRIAEKYLGKNILIVNKAGGNTAIAASYVLNQPADGYTLMHFSAGLTGFMNTPGYPAKPADFDYLVNAQTISFMLAVDSKLPIKNFKEFVKYAKKNPGKITVSGSRIGSMHHQNLFTMTKECGLQVQYLPTKGGSEAMKNLLGRHVQGLVYDPKNMAPYIKQGNITPILVFSNERDPMFPDVPTPAEVGLKMQPIPQVRGVMAKAGIPQDVRDVILKAYQSALADPEWKAYLETTNSFTENLTPAEMKARFMRDFEDAKTYMKDIGIFK